MMLLFGVSSKHIKFFNKIKKYSTCKVNIVYSKRIFKFSFKSLKYLKYMDFSEAVDLRVKDFFARRNSSLIPKNIAKFIYKFLALYYYMRYFNVINEKYEKIMLWNGMTFRQTIAVQIAQLYNIKPIYMENAFLPNRIVVDTKGVNFYNSVPREKEFFLKYKNDKELPKELIPRKPKNAKKFLNIEKYPLPKNYIFIPFQVDYDTQIMLFSPWIKNMRELFYIIEDISKSCNLSFVFKEHPSSIKNYPDLHLRCNDKIIFANGYPTQELIQKSKGVITINSSVGVESLLYHKKVFVLGKAFYRIEGITQGINSKEELLQALKNLDKWKLDNYLIDNFLKYLYYDYLIEGNFIDYDENQIKQIEKRLGC